MNLPLRPEVEKAFAVVLEVPEAEQESFLAREYARDPELRSEVESLLRAHCAAGSFLEPPGRTPFLTGNAERMVEVLCRLIRHRAGVKVDAGLSAGRPACWRGFAAMSETNPNFDSQKAEAFASRLLNALNDGGLCLMASIGHRTGLFDAMRGQPPMTSAEIAARARLNERYVREWLGAMVTAGVVYVDPPHLAFSLPPEHAAFLTRAAAPDNIAVYTQYIALLGCVEEAIVDCFKNGGGVPYDRFPRFQAVMAEDSGQSVVSSVESHILPLVPGLADQLARGIRALDVGCGRGRMLIRLAELFPNSQFVGMDLSEEAIHGARTEASARGLTNIEFLAIDLSDFDEKAEPEAFHFVMTFDAVHDQARPFNVLKGIHRALRRNGVYLMQDIRASSHVYKNIAHPLGTFLYTISCMHCMTVSLAQAGEGLGAMWGEEKTREYLGRAGFRSVEKHELAHDIQNNWYVIRK